MTPPVYSWQVHLDDARERDSGVYAYMLRNAITQAFPARTALDAMDEGAAEALGIRKTPPSRTRVRCRLAARIAVQAWQDVEAFRKAGHVFIKGENGLTLEGAAFLDAYTRGKKV